MMNGGNRGGAFKHTRLSPPLFEERKTIYYGTNYGDCSQKKKTFQVMGEATEEIETRTRGHDFRPKKKHVKVIGAGE